MQYETKFWGRESLGEILSDIADALFWGPRNGGIRAGSMERPAGWWKTRISNTDPSASRRTGFLTANRLDWRRSILCPEGGNCGVGFLPGDFDEFFVRRLLTVAPALHKYMRIYL